MTYPWLLSHSSVQTIKRHRSLVTCKYVAPLPDERAPHGSAFQFDRVQSSRKRTSLFYTWACCVSNSRDPTFRPIRTLSGPQTENSQTTATRVKNHRRNNSPSIVRLAACPA